jgi:hypothetical protein
VNAVHSSSYYQPQVVPVTMDAVRWHYLAMATEAEAGMGEYAEQIQFVKIQ